MSNAKDSDKEFLDVLLAASDPASSKGLSADDLAISLGINDLPSADEAIAKIEQTVLAPVKDLSGSELYKWQM